MRHQRAFRAFSIAAFSVLVPYVANYLTDTATGDAATSEAIPAVVEGDAESCVDVGDKFQLDVPGTYLAFATGSSDSLLTEVRESDGELLATSHPTMATTSAVDLPSGLRFGIAAPQVFKVESSVTIQVHHDDSPYELVLVRIDGKREFSRMNVRPPVERLVNESGSCLMGDLRETFKIHTDAVYSDTGARQVFVVDSPNGSTITERQSSGSIERQCELLKALSSPTTAYSPLTSRFFAIR